MSKSNKQDKVEAIKRVQLLIFDYLTEFKDDNPDNVLDEMEYIATQLETRLQKLLAPPVPKPPRKQDSKSPAALELEHLQRTQTTGTVIPVPDGLRHTDNAITKTKRSKQ